MRAFGKPLGLAFLVLPSLLLGCSHTPPPVPATSEVQAAPVSFDGVYKGQIRITDMASEARGQKWCDTNPRWVVMVKGNAFHYTLAHPYAPQGDRAFEVAIAPDGTFSSETVNGEATMTGRINGSHMEGAIHGLGCGYAFAADRSG